MEFIDIQCISFESYDWLPVGNSRFAPLYIEYALGLCLTEAHNRIHCLYKGSVHEHILSQGKK